MLKAHVLFLILIFAFGSAWSNDIIKPIDQTKTAKQSANADKQGTEQNPFIIKVDATKKSKAESDEDQSDKLEHSHNESLIAYGTIALAIITLILACATIILAAFTYKLWKATVKLVRGAEETSGRQADEMQRSLAIAEKQHELQRWQYLTTHRPKLIIRRMSLDEGDKDGSMCPNIQFIVANIGGSRATIIESNATFAKIDGLLPAIPPYSADTNTINCTIREAGQSDPPEILGIEDFEVSRIVRSWRDKTITNGDSSPFYFFGYIQYRDSIDIVRRMTFCRKYNPATKRFVEVDDPEYEYAD